MASEEILKKKVDKRSLVVVGKLPDDFLRIDVPRSNDDTPPGIDSERRIDQYLRNSIRVSITIVQAQLAKNYGLTRMDPYCKLNIGTVTFQTVTAINGAKTPVWNKIIILLLAPEINDFDLEIYDEKSFTPDTRFAWTHIRIPERVFHGDDQNHWYPLSGLTGVDTEGHVNVLFTLLSPTAEALKLKAPFLTHSPNHHPTMQPNLTNPQSPNPQPPNNQPSVPPNQTTTTTTTTSTTSNPEDAKNEPKDEKHLMNKRIDEDDDGDDEEETKRKLGILKDMFSGTANEVILLVLESKHGDIDASINALLEMQVA